MPRCYPPVRSRCAHPGQQQGRRWPCSSCSWVRRMRRSRVTCCFASSTQQMNSLRARGVMSLQAASATGLPRRAVPKSLGSACTTPPGGPWASTTPRVSKPPGGKIPADATPSSQSPPGKPVDLELSGQPSVHSCHRRPVAIATLSPPPAARDPPGSTDDRHHLPHVDLTRWLRRRTRAKPREPRHQPQPDDALQQCLFALGRETHRHHQPIMTREHNRLSTIACRLRS
jgi:hypothetical protein